MKFWKLFIVIFLLFFSKFGFSQNYFGFKIGTTYPFVDYEHSRRFGAELGLFYGKKLNEKMFLETGFNLDCYGRSNNPVMHEHKGFFDSVPKIVIEDGSFLRFSAHIPVLLNYITSVNNLRLNTGLLLSGRNLLTFTDYHGFDPEVKSSSRGYYPLGRLFAFEWQVGADYRIIGHFLLSLNYRTSLNDHFIDDGLLVLGLKYNIME